MFTRCGRFETAGFHCSVLTQPTTVLAFRTQRERQRGGERERPSSGGEVEWAKQEHRGFWGWIRDREALMPKLTLNQGCLLHRGFNGSSVIYLYSLKSIHTAGALRERDFYRWLLQVLIAFDLVLIVLAQVFASWSAFVMVLSYSTP